MTTPSSCRYNLALAAILSAGMLALAAPTASSQRLPETINTSDVPHEPAPSRLVAPIDERMLVTLPGHVRQDVAHAPDLGLVEDGMPMRLSLLLQRTPEQQADLNNLIANQQTPGSPEYHQWLTPAEFGARFGASQDDIAKLSGWLQSHGFQIRGMLKNASAIDFEATAGQVRTAFHTDLHYVSIAGGKYTAVLQEPKIPAALAPVVAGIHGLNKIPLTAAHTAPRNASWDKETHSWHIDNPTARDLASPALNAGSGYYFVGPQDLYTIYNVNPVFKGGNLAANATVAVIEQSDMEYGTVDPSTGATDGGDVATFRSLFGVPGTLNMYVFHGYGADTCNDPGIDPNGIGEDFEASIDAEWINATAPSATLIFMSCDQSPDNGIYTSLQAVIDNNLADVMSISYGGSELGFDTADYQAFDTLWAEAATQGQSILISSGDSGSDVADQNTAGTAINGINVSGLSTSPLVTAAGGTDFQDAYDSYEVGTPQSTYWSDTNSAFLGDALSYVPETAWNNSCASSIVAALFGYEGADLCATGGFTNGSVVGGSGGISTHYAVPSYQVGISGYSNTMRSVPDIAGFAADSPWGHALMGCDSNPNFESGEADCINGVGIAGGTSFVAPYMAGVFGLVRNATGARQGPLNSNLYALAKKQYAAAGTATACYANGQTLNAGTTTGLPAAACVFNDVTTSNNDVPCAAGSTSCYVDSGASFGMLSLDGSSSLSVAYPSTPGFDQVTGLGSVNVANLIKGWVSGEAPQTITFTPKAGTYTAPQSVVINDSVPGATIYYTTDNSTPTTSSPVFNSATPISVNVNTTIRALGIAFGHKNSSMTMAVYNLKVATPTFSPNMGTYMTPQQVYLSDTTPNAVIWYTTDGSTPGPSMGTSVMYNGTPILVTQDTPIRAIATVTGWTSSNLAAGTYLIKVAMPVITPKSGTYSPTVTLFPVTITDATPSTTIWYTTDGTTPGVGTGTSQQYGGSPFNIFQTTTVKAIASLTGLTTSSMTTNTFTLKVPTPTFSVAAGTYGATQTVTISDTNPAAIIWYTTDGSTPAPGGSTSTEVRLAKPENVVGPSHNVIVTISKTTTLKAIAVITGWTNSNVELAVYTLKVPTPTFSEPGGVYTSAQSISISDTDSGATIWYTTNGTNPTPGVLPAVQYNGTPIPVNATTSIRAIAAETGWTNSMTAAAMYTIRP